jgi:hypothetical protein
MELNEIEIPGGAIVIQSCDDESAHIGIWIRGRMTYHHVSTPSLIREWRLVYYNEEVKPDEFDKILQANKSRLLEAIQKLNATEPSQVKQEG